GRLLDDHVVSMDGGPVLLHYVFASGGGAVPADAELRAAVLAVVRTWDEALRDVLAARLDVDAAGRLAARWGPAFPEGYRAEVPPERAAADVAALHAVARDGRMRVAVRDGDRARTTELRVYVAGEPLVLSEFMP